MGHQGAHVQAGKGTAPATALSLQPLGLGARKEGTVLHGHTHRPSLGAMCGRGVSGARGAMQGGVVSEGPLWGPRAPTCTLSLQTASFMVTGGGGTRDPAASCWDTGPRNSSPVTESLLSSIPSKFSSQRGWGAGPRVVSRVPVPPVVAQMANGRPPPPMKGEPRGVLAPEGGTGWKPSRLRQSFA